MVPLLSGLSWNSSPRSSGSAGLGGRASLCPSLSPAAQAPPGLWEPCFFRKSVGSPVFLHSPGPSLGTTSILPEQSAPPTSHRPCPFPSPFPYLPGREWRVPRAQGEKTTWTRTPETNPLCTLPSSCLIPPLTLHSLVLGIVCLPNSCHLHKNRAFCSLLCCCFPGA